MIYNYFNIIVHKYIIFLTNSESKPPMIYNRNDSLTNITKNKIVEISNSDVSTF